MAQAEAVDGVLRWLEDLRCPHERSEELAGLVAGDFGASLLWLSQHAVGRRHAVHIKTELHRLREEAPTKLSAPRRAELGLDTWPTAIKKAGQLQAEDSRMSEVLQGTLRDQREAERSHSASIDELMRRKILLTALTDLEDTTAQQQARISALTALIEDWTTESRSKLERPSAAQDVANTRQVLREGGQELSLDSMATPTYLDELANMLAKVKSQLQDHVERHQAIRPPPIDGAEEQLYALQKHCLDLSQPSTSDPTPPQAPTGDRGRLLQALAEARARRIALRDEAAKLRAEPSPPPVYDQAIREARSKAASQENRVKELLQLRANVLARIASDAENIRDPLTSVLADLDAAVPAASSSLDAVKAAEVASYTVSSTKVAPPEHSMLLSPLSEDMQLARDARRALQTAHLLDRTPPLASSTPPAVVEQACDSIAHSRFTLEALRPPLAAQIDSSAAARAAELDELVRLRLILSDGKLLPPTRGADGQTVAQQWRRGERELAKEGKSTKVKEGRR